MKRDTVDVAAVLRPRAEEPVPVLLMNTVWADRSGTHDSLSTSEELSAWIAAVAERLPGAVGKPMVEVTGDDLDVFRELRAALRRLAVDTTVDTRVRVLEALDLQDARRAVELVNAATAAAPPVPTLAWPERVAHQSIPAGVRPAVAALSAVAAFAVELFGTAGHEGLRACLGPGCVLYFAKDHPRREWCSASCGNRARARRHYDRHRSPAGGGRREL